MGNSEGADIDSNALCGKWKGVAPGPMAPGGDGGAAIVDCVSPLQGSIVSVKIKGDAEVLTVCEIQVFQVCACVCVRVCV